MLKSICRVDEDQAQRRLAVKWLNVKEHQVDYYEFESKITQTENKRCSVTILMTPPSSSPILSSNLFSFPFLQHIFLSMTHLSLERLVTKTIGILTNMSNFLLG